MNQTLIGGILLVVVLAGGYWLLTSHTAEAPVTEETNTTEQPTDPATDGYIGLSEAEAEALATQNGVPFRVVELDGEALMVTEDYRPGRINAVVEGGVVVSYTVEGADVEASAEGGVTGEHDAIIGLTQAEAEAYAEAEGVPFRIGSIDGEAQPVTMDYVPGRITASLESGIVTSYTVE